MAFSRTNSASNSIAKPVSNSASNSLTVNNMSFEIEALGENLVVSMADVKTILCPEASDVDCRIFLETCKAYHLNPFTKDAYLIKYDSKAPASIVMGKSCYMQRAEARSEFDGFEAGIIAFDPESGEIDRREGSMLYDGEEILGGWAKVYRKDRTRPYYDEVEFSEYNTGKSQWAAKPATMIRKVALVHALREAFPSCYGGIYDESEIAVAAESTAREIEPEYPTNRRRSRTKAPTKPAVEIPDAEENPPEAEDDPFMAIEPEEE